MKFILKILFAPIILILWFITGLCTVLVRISATVLFFVAILFEGPPSDFALRGWDKTSVIIGTALIAAKAAISEAA